MRIVALAALFLSGSDAAAGEWEATLLAGKAFPFYDQTFEYDPGPLAPPLAGTTIEQRGTFRLHARGALTAGGVVAYHFSSVFGVEARLDTADVAVDTVGALYRVRADLPPPLPDLVTDVDLGSGSVDLERLRPISIGVRLRTRGRWRITGSAGLSYLPAFRFRVAQAVGLGLPSFDGRRLDVDVARVSLGAEARPDQEGEGRLGVQAGASVSYPLGRRVRATADVRYFAFQPQTIRWERAHTDSPLPRLQEEIARQVESRLEPVRFNPTFFHAGVGLALRF